MIHIGADYQRKFTRRAFFRFVPLQKFRKSPRRSAEFFRLKGHAHRNGQNGTVWTDMTQKRQQNLNGMIPDMAGNIG